MSNKREDESAHRPAAPWPASPAAAPIPASSASADARTTAGVGPSTTLVGEVTGDDDLTIFGRLEGKVDLPANTVTIVEGARVKADIRARSVSVAGEVNGNVVATEQIVIRKTATMLGNLAAPRVGLEDGCRFRGSVEMETPPANGQPSAPGAGEAPAGGSSKAPAKPGSGRS